MSEPTLYQIDLAAMDDLDRDAKYRMMERGVLVPVEPEVGWLTVEDIGPSVATIVNYEEQPDFMYAEKALIVRIGGDDDK